MDTLFSRYQIYPRYIRDTSDFNMKVQLLGEEINFPICAAPTVGQCMLHWEGEIATARGENFNCNYSYFSLSG